MIKPEWEYEQEIAALRKTIDSCTATIQTQAERIAKLRDEGFAMTEAYYKARADVLAELTGVEEKLRRRAEWAEARLEEVRRVVEEELRGLYVVSKSGTHLPHVCDEILRRLDEGK